MKRIDFITKEDLMKVNPILTEREAELIAHGYGMAVNIDRVFSPFNPETDEKLTSDEIREKGNGLYVKPML